MLGRDSSWTLRVEHWSLILLIINNDLMMVDLYLDLTLILPGMVTSPPALVLTHVSCVRAATFWIQSRNPPIIFLHYRTMKKGAHVSSDVVVWHMFSRACILNVAAADSRLNVVFLAPSLRRHEFVLGYGGERPLFCKYTLSGQQLEHIRMSLPPAYNQSLFIIRSKHMFHLYTRSV